MDELNSLLEQKPEAPELSPSPSKSEPSKKVFVAIAVIVIFAALFWFFDFKYRIFRGEEKKEVEEINIKTYSFSGTITKIDGLKLAVEVESISSANSDFLDYKTKNVLITTKTAISRITPRQTETGGITHLKTTLTLFDLKVGSKVVVYSSENPESVEVVTAERLDVVR